MENAQKTDTKKLSTIDTTKILETIINSKRYGESFIPEVDGKEMLMKMLPLEEAKAAGKGSELYQRVLSAFNTVTEYLTMMQNGITPSIPMHQSTKNYCAPRSDTHRREDPRPYAGPYGHWK